MCVFSAANGALFSVIANKTGSIWPAALAHGALNAIGSLPFRFFGTVEFGAEFNSGSFKFLYTAVMGIPILIWFCILLVGIIRKSQKSTGKDTLRA